MEGDVVSERPNFLYLLLHLNTLELYQSLKGKIASSDFIIVSIFDHVNIDVTAKSIFHEHQHS